MTEIVAQQATGNNTLPDSWQWARVEHLGDVVTGSTPSTKVQEFYGGSVPFFKPTDLNAGYQVSKSETTLTAAGAENARVLPAKSILVTCIGATIGKTGLSQVEGATNQQINALVPSKGYVVSEYLYFAFISRLMQDQVLRNASSTTLPILNKSKFSALKIPLPPLNEQRRIVEKIEELFTKLDAGIRSLEQARAQLKSYRRSVLKAAVEGELSREWREAHRDELEPASELLERILQERREKLVGKKYKELAFPDTSELPALPDEWTWASVQQIADTSSGGTSSRKRLDLYEGDIPWVKSGELRDSIITSTEEHISDAALQSSSAKLFPKGALLIALYGATIGQLGILGTQAATNQAVCAIFLPPQVSVHYMFYVLRHYRRALIEQGKGGAQPNISQGIVRATVVPLPPLVEQHFVVEEVERRLSIVDKLEANVEANLKQASVLRQSILKRAFSGELVAQDPDDEPASVLLERIREEHQAAKPKPRRKRKQTARPASSSHAAQGGLF